MSPKIRKTKTKKKLTNDQIEKQLTNLNKKLPKDSFQKFRIIDIILSKINAKKINNFHVVKNSDTWLLYNRENNVLYRNIDKKKYEIWKELFYKGINIEPFYIAPNKKIFKNDIGKITKKELEKIKELDIDINLNDIIIKSKPVGFSLNMHEQHPIDEIITIQKLIKKKQIKNFTNFEKLNIARQMVTTIIKLWDAGYIHGHPHIGNWAIKFKKGIPKVTLIDLDAIEQLNVNKNRIKLLKLKIKKNNNKIPVAIMKELKTINYYKLVEDYNMFLVAIEKMNLDKKYEKKLKNYLNKKYEKINEKYNINN